MQSNTPVNRLLITGGAFIVSLEPEDTDGDGLLNRWETSTANIDPNAGPQLPDLAGMGADPCRKDLFVELGYFREPSTGGWDQPPSGIANPGAAFALARVVAGWERNRADETDSE